MVIGHCGEDRIFEVWMRLVVPVTRRGGQWSARRDHEDAAVVEHGHLGIVSKHVCVPSQ